MKLQELCEVTNTAYVTGEVAALDKKKRKQQDAQFKTTSKKISEAKKKPPVDDSPLAQLKELPQPIGVNGGSYTYWVDVTKTPLKFTASDGSEMSKVSTLEGIKPWLDKHMAEFWQEFLDGDETLDFMIEEGVIRVKKGRTDQQDHETRQRMGESKKVPDAGPVGVPTPSPEAKKNRKMAQAVVAGYRKHVKTSGFNQSYAKKHPKEMKEESDTYAGRARAALAEGQFVVKSKDGVEKRFKDFDSVEAKAWKASDQKKTATKVALHSNAYWEKKEDESDDHDFITPWSKITGEDDQIERLVKDQHGAGKTDWTLGKAGEQVRDGTNCATRVVRIMFEYGPEDDMGVTEPTSDAQSILVARNPKKPKQLDFIKYV